MVTIIHFLDYADLVGEFRRFSLKSSNTFKIIVQESGTIINFHGETNSLTYEIKVNTTGASNIA